MQLQREPQLTLSGGPSPLVAVDDGFVCVKLIPKEQADALIRAGHYSGSTCWASSMHFGVFVAGQILGALQYGPLMNPASASKIVSGSTARSCMELNRMWLDDGKPANTTTRALAFSLRILRSQRPYVEWVQSFADERCGKAGGVYQAASFLYCGEHVGTFLELDGEWFHKSALRRRDRRGWGTGPKIGRLNAGADRATEHSFRQFRYVKPLTSRARRNLLLPVLPYPKPNRTERMTSPAGPA